MLWGERHQTSFTFIIAAYRISNLNKTGKEEKSLHGCDCTRWQ